MARVAQRAELAKLAYVLGSSPEQLAHLQALPAAQMRTMRVAVYERMFAHDQGVYARLAALVRRLPTWLVALLAPRFGARLVARIAGDLPVKRAVAIAERLQTGFLADVTRDLDPRRVGDLIRQLSVDKICAVALELFRREEFLIMGRFVNYLTDAAVQAVLPQMDNDEHLARVAFYVESRNRLSHIVRLMPEERLRRIILQGVEPDCPILLELIALVVNVSYAQQRDLGDLAAAQDEAVLERILETAQSQGLWADLLPVIGVLSEVSQRKAVNLPMLQQDPVFFRSILQTAHEHDLWSVALPLTQHMNEAARDVVSQAISEMPKAALEQALNAALMGERWILVLDLAKRLPPAKQREVAALVVPYGEVHPALLHRLVRRVGELGYGEVFEGLLPPALEAELPTG
ncbi:MAG: hypothetical protein L0H19_04890 [Salinisphaera sp.]|nr:hypothetical protein [Salinisphaera sp.]MDN5938736.1 hypothetical protein [Salinisphaera sp.]